MPYELRKSTVLKRKRTPSSRIPVPSKRTRTATNTAAAAAAAAAVANLRTSFSIPEESVHEFEEYEENESGKKRSRLAEGEPIAPGAWPNDSPELEEEEDAPEPNDERSQLPYNQFKSHPYGIPETESNSEESSPEPSPQNSPPENPLQRDRNADLLDRRNAHRAAGGLELLDEEENEIEDDGDYEQAQPYSPPVILNPVNQRRTRQGKQPREGPAPSSPPKRKRGDGEPESDKEDEEGEPAKKVRMVQGNRRRTERPPYSASQSRTRGQTRFDRPAIPPAQTRRKKKKNEDDEENEGDESPTSRSPEVWVQNILNERRRKEEERRNRDRRNRGERDAAGGESSERGGKGDNDKGKGGESHERGKKKEDSNRGEGEGYTGDDGRREEARGGNDDGGDKEKDGKDDKGRKDDGNEKDKDKKNEEEKDDEEKEKEDDETEDDNDTNLPISQQATPNLSQASTQPLHSFSPQQQRQSPEQLPISQQPTPHISQESTQPSQHAPFQQQQQPAADDNPQWSFNSGITEADEDAIPGGGGPVEGFPAQNYQGPPRNPFRSGTENRYQGPPSRHPNAPSVLSEGDPSTSAWEIQPAAATGVAQCQGRVPNPWVRGAPFVIRPSDSSSFGQEIARGVSPEARPGPDYNQRLWWDQEQQRQGAAATGNTQSPGQQGLGRGATAAPPGTSGQPGPSQAATIPSSAQASAPENNNTGAAGSQQRAAGPTSNTEHRAGGSGGRNGRSGTRRQQTIQTPLGITPSQRAIAPTQSGTPATQTPAGAVASSSTTTPGGLDEYGLPIAGPPGMPLNSWIRIVQQREQIQAAQHQSIIDEQNRRRREQRLGEAGPSTGPLHESQTREEGRGNWAEAAEERYRQFLEPRGQERDPAAESRRQRRQVPPPPGYAYSTIYPAFLVPASSATAAPNTPGPNMPRPSGSRPPASSHSRQATIEPASRPLLFPAGSTAPGSTQTPRNLPVNQAFYQPSNISSQAATEPIPSNPTSMSHSQASTEPMSSPERQSPDDPSDSTSEDDSEDPNAPIVRDFAYPEDHPLHRPGRKRKQKDKPHTKNTLHLQKLKNDKEVWDREKQEADDLIVTKRQFYERIYALLRRPIPNALRAQWTLTWDELARRFHADQDDYEAATVAESVRLAAEREQARQAAAAQAATRLERRARTNSISGRVLPSVDGSVLERQHAVRTVDRGRTVADTVDETMDVVGRDHIAGRTRAGRRFSDEEMTFDFEETARRRFERGKEQYKREAEERKKAKKE